MAAWPHAVIAHQVESLLHESHHPPENERKIIRDILDCCRQFKGLKPRLEVVPTNTATCRFIVVEGVIPVTYRGVQYYIPVMIQLGRQYPDEAPIPYVKPTPSMVIRERHRHVDKSGRVWIPHVLDNWTHPNYTLYSLVLAMIQIFATSPPVHSRPTGSSSSSSNTNTNSQQYAQQSHRYQQYQSHNHNQYSHSHGYDQYKAHEEQEKKELREKLSKKLADRFNETYNELTSDLCKQSVENDQMKSRISELSAKTEEESKGLDNLRKTLEELTQKEATLQSWKENTYDKITEEQQQNIDTLLQFHDMSTHQIAKCIAEDYAITDTMDQIDEAFVKNIISHDKYLREIRTLSRKQFYPRALKQKLELQLNQPQTQRQQTNTNATA